MRLYSYYLHLVINYYLQPKKIHLFLTCCQVLFLAKIIINMDTLI